MKKLWEFFIRRKDQVSATRRTEVSTSPICKKSERTSNHQIDMQTSRFEKFVAFDHEIAKIIEGDFSQWRLYRPLGIICSALYVEDLDVELDYGKTLDGRILPKMETEHARNLVIDLLSWVEKGYTILTWNGLGFDFDVLAEESGLWEECKYLALTHVDMMFHFFCIKGYPLKLDKAAKGMELAGKLPGVTGDQAPILWQQGQYKKVLDYVAQDSVTTLEVARAVEKSGYISWKSNNGRYQRVEFPNGWLTVEEACTLPLPDTTWISNPLRRTDFYNWTTKQPTNRNYSFPISPGTKNPPPIEPIKPQYNKFGRELDFSEIEDIKEQRLSKLQMLGCPCPICRGDPGSDHVFLYKHRVDEEYNYDDYD